MTKFARISIANGTDVHTLPYYVNLSLVKVAKIFIANANYYYISLDGNTVYGEWPTLEQAQRVLDNLVDLAEIGDRSDLEI